MSKTILLWPPPNKNSRFFDEYYQHLFKNQIFEVHILNDFLKIDNSIFRTLINRQFFRKLIQKKLQNKDILIHFTTQLHAYPDLAKNYIVTMHDTLHLNTFFSGTFYNDDIENRIKKSLQNAKGIITISKFSMAKIKLYYRPKCPITIIYNGVQEQNTNCTKKEIDILFIGTNAPRKNLITFLEAISHYQKFMATPISVTIISNLDDYGFGATYRRVIKSLAIKGITIKQNVSKEDLHSIYLKSRLFISTSFEEGFGLPALEAQSYGIPVLLSNIPVYNEIFQDSASYFNPNCYDNIANVINQHLINPEVIKKYSAYSIENAKRFKLTQMVQNTIDCYKKN